jgi:assimilatory nitrate reductase catalytic subunit
LALDSGTDSVLFNGLLHYLKQNDQLDLAFLEKSTSGLSEALEAADGFSIPKVAQICALEESEVARFFSLFAKTEKVVTVFAQGVHQSSSGADKINSIINCHLATGRIGHPGQGPFSLTGQINAMGGREVGGLANQLAAHMKIENVEDRNLVQEFWKSPRIPTRPGLKAVDLFKAIGNGQVKAVWIMATNPLASLPEADLVRQALQKCPLVIISENVRHTDTTAFGHILFPAAAWGEKNGTVTNSERCISRQRPFLPLPGEARPDWWIVCEMARHLGFVEAFSFSSPADIFREHAALSGYKNKGQRDFDISSFGEISDQSYDHLLPFQWPAPSSKLTGTRRLFSDGQFFTSDEKARLVPVHPRPPARQRSLEYPLVLNTGRIRDQWHTMTRTGKAPRLLQHISEPFVEVSVGDAKFYGLKNNGLARVSTEHGHSIVKVSVSERQKHDHIFIPFHWTRQFSSDGPINALVNAEVDPGSGQPEFKHTPARIEAYPVACQGFILSRQVLKVEHADFWVKVPFGSFWRYEIADSHSVQEWVNWIKDILKTDAEAGTWSEYHDSAKQNYRGAWMSEDHLSTCLFLSAEAILPNRLWLQSLFAKNKISRSERLGILSGVPPMTETL